MIKKNNGPGQGRSSSGNRRPAPRIKGVTVMPGNRSNNPGNNFNSQSGQGNSSSGGKRIVTANRGGIGAPRPGSSGPNRGPAGSNRSSTGPSRGGASSNRGPAGAGKSRRPAYGGTKRQPGGRSTSNSMYPPRKRPSAQKEFSPTPNLTNSDQSPQFYLHRYKLTLEYDGSRFSGWQVQPNAKTIQGEILKAAIEAFDDNRIEVHGSGRTDAGVHAIAQIAHIDLPRKINTDIIMYKLNDLLPPDININSVELVDNNFHARKDAVTRSYIYQIATRRTALAKKYVWWIKDELDVERMNEHLHLFLGMQNFLSFSDDDPEEKSTMVLVEEMRLEVFGNLIVFRIRASHFLWKMVRRVIGVLVEVGKGKMGEEDITKFLTSATRTPAQFTAPPSGLFLEKVYYENDELLDEIKPVIYLD